MYFAIINGPIFDGDKVLEDHAVIVKNNGIKSVVPINELPSDIEHSHDLNGNLLAPGFLDLQVNGGGGVLFNNEPTVDAIAKIGEAHRQFGTTAFLPTLITSSFEVMRQAVEAVENAIDQGVPGVLGIHLEGPFLNESKKGTHDANKFCVIDEEGFELITSLANGKTLITIAPELTTTSMISRINSKGIVISIGHSNANYDQACEALQAGATGFTHLYNGMTPLQSREPGVVGAALADRNSWFGIIADGHHIHPASFSTAIAAKQTGGALLVTDAMPMVGSDDDFFELDGEKIYSVDGRCVNAAGSLAGSDLNMISAVINAEKFANIDFYEAIRMASQYPAKAMGLDHKLGFIKSNYEANFVSLDNNRNVTNTWVGGKVNS